MRFIRALDIKTNTVKALLSNAFLSSTYDSSQTETEGSDIIVLI